MFEAGNVTVMVSDLSRAVQFYTEALGLGLKLRAGDAWAEVQAPGLTIALHPAGSHGPQPGRAGSLSLGLQVENLEVAMEALTGKGVEFSSHIMDDGQVRLAFFTDPDQTPLYLCEVKGRAAQR